MIVGEGVAGFRSLRRSSRRLAGELGIHCLLSLGGLRGRGLGAILVTLSERRGLVCFGRSPSERENAWELITTGDLIRLVVEGDLRGVMQGVREVHSSPNS